MTRSLVQNQFGANAAAYATSDVHARGESLAMLVAMSAPRPEWVGLDVATGAGHMALAFSPYVAHIIASDITEEMLTEARALADKGGHSNVETAVARAERLPFPDQTFDFVCCRLAAHHFLDVAAFVSEAVRVLKPGGTFALVDNVSPDATTSPGLDRDALRTAGIVYNQFEKLRDPSHGRALTIAEWVELVADAGLAITGREFVVKEMAFGPWVQRMACDAATVARLTAMLDRSPDNARGGLVAFLMPRDHAGDVWFSLREMLLVARKPR